MKLTHAALFCGLFAAAPALAQSPLMPVTVSIQRYDQIVNATGDTGLACCAPHILESGPATDFLHIRMVFDVAFSDTLDRVSVNSSDIVLMLPGAEEGLRAIGHYDHVGIFDEGASGIFARRPRDWPNETAQAFVDSVWMVPDGVTTATLQVGEEGAQIAVPVDLNVAQSQPVSPGQTVQVAVTGFGVEADLTLSERRNNQQLAGRVTPLSGQALRMEVSVTPLMSTSTEAQAGENRHLMYAGYLSLVGPDGLPMPFLGTRAGDGLRRTWSVSSSWDNSPRPHDMTLYYLGNPGPGTYTVYYLQDAVAQFNLQ
jgi:hypothetical protein